MMKSRKKLFYRLIRFKENIKTLPLHHTQEVLIDNDEELKVKLKLCITHDFIMELLSFGNNMEVLQPESLVNEIKNAHEKAFLQYLL